MRAEERAAENKPDWVNQAEFNRSADQAARWIDRFWWSLSVGNGAGLAGTAAAILSDPTGAKWLLPSAWLFFCGVAVSMALCRFQYLIHWRSGHLHELRDKRARRRKEARDTPEEAQEDAYDIDRLDFAWQERDRARLISLLLGGVASAAFALGILLPLIGVTLLGLCRC